MIMIQEMPALPSLLIINDVYRLLPPAGEISWHHLCDRMRVTDYCHMHDIFKILYFFQSLQVLFTILRRRNHAHRFHLKAALFLLMVAASGLQSLRCVQVQLFGPDTGVT